MASRRDGDADRDITPLLAGIELNQLFVDLARMALNSFDSAGLESRRCHPDNFDGVETGKLDLRRLLVGAQRRLGKRDISRHRLAPALREQITEEQGKPIYEALKNAALLYFLHRNDIAAIDQIAVEGHVDDTHDLAIRQRCSDRLLDI